MNLSTSAILLVRHVLTYTGEMEVGQQGNEVLAVRRLNAEESAQRRHFFKNTEEVAGEYNNKMSQSHTDFKQFKNEFKEKLKTENPIGVDEKADLYEKKIENLTNSSKEITEKLKSVNTPIEDLLKVKNAVELTDKTKSVIKKYFSDFTFTTSDDEVVEEISAEFGI